jgi:hypothetical protein
LTQDNHTEGVEPQDTGGGEDSAIIKALRKQVKDQKAELESRPDRETLIAELRNELVRDGAIEEELTFFGHPKGILDTVKGKLGDAEVTRESVAEALKGIGYQVEEADASAGDGTEQSAQASDLAKVSTLSSRVRSAAQGEPSDAAMQRINKADTPAELAAIMAELGLSAQLS